MKKKPIHHFLRPLRSRVEFAGLLLHAHLRVDVPNFVQWRDLVVRVVSRSPERQCLIQIRQRLLHLSQPDVDLADALQSRCFALLISSRRAHGRQSLVEAIQRKLLLTGP